jgi:hypothetical protein
MAIQDYEQVSYNPPGLSQHRAYAQEVIQSVGATRTLVAKESGALCLNDVATGIVWTLPTPVVGMTFEFGTTVSRTSTNAYKIITSASTIFLLGAVISGDSTIATSGDIFTANGTTHRAIVLDGDTKGGLIGEKLVFTAISATQWYVRGIVIGTGTMVDPFTTS